MGPYRYERVNAADIMDVLREHSRCLSSPWDSYMEESILKNDAYLLHCDGVPIGYASIAGNQLFSFFVAKPYYKMAPDVLAHVIGSFRIETAEVLTNDPLFAGLIMEWDYRVKDRSGCFFTDGGRCGKPALQADNPIFREACDADIPAIQLYTGDFFDRLAERIAGREIFVLEDGDRLMGCGIVERGRIHEDCVSIGMITCKEHRRKGVAQTILWHLKEWAYRHELRPIAGCWYYNVLSRKSLEACNMIPTGKSFSVALQGKQALPLRTGNPPGELV